MLRLVDVYVCLVLLVLGVIPASIDGFLYLMKAAEVNTDGCISKVLTLAHLHRDF